MNTNAAADILKQLGNATRLEITRLLVRAGDKGMLVGELQQSIGIPGSTLSHHLKALKIVGVVSQHRQSNQLQCIANFQAIEEIVEYLTAECCIDDK